MCKLSAWLCNRSPPAWAVELQERIVDVSEQLDELILLATASATREEQELMTLAELKAKVEQAVTVEESAVTLIGGIAQQLKDAIASNDPAAIQAVADELDKGTADLAAAIEANTAPTA